MLGGQTWAVCLGLPTVVVGGFIMSRRHLSYQWRDQLMDMDASIYPTTTSAQMSFVRQVAAPTSQPLTEADRRGTVMETSDNIGLSVEPATLSSSEVVVYLNEVKQWVGSLGNAVDTQKVKAFEERVRVLNQDADGDTSPARLDATFYREQRIISDHAEDTQLMRAPWGCGDRIQMDKMPAALRDLVNRVAERHPGVGRLRHVYIEYSPQGKFFHEPTMPKYYDGHDYVVLPLRRDESSTVITFTPTLRSRYPTLTDIMTNSWTSRDVDCGIPSGGSLRVYGLARYEWSWALRPGPVWFGSPRNLVHAPSDYLSLKNEYRPSIWSWNYWTHVLRAQPSPRPPRALPHMEAMAPGLPSTTEAALLFLHFEGPQSNGKTRSLFLHPESLIFGAPPTVDTYDLWVEAVPTRKEVTEQGLISFLISHYFEMLKVS